ncbi:MAG: type II toxin-antitoxin system VapC family toxin [Opitutales bacterium]
MRLLLDTHAVLWFLRGDARLSAVARAAIESAESECLLSRASLWEISIKQSLGKLKLAEPFEERLSSALLRNRIGDLPLERAHLFAVARLPFHHRDPFDRLLVAVARIESLPLVSRDPCFERYGIEIVW